MRINALVVGLCVAGLGSGALIYKALVSGKPGDDIRLVSVDWKPQTSTIDPGYVDVAKRLLGNGLADPRGGNFCKCSLSIGDAAWNRSEPKEAYGWVLPDKMHVVLLDGVEYPVTSQTEPANLRTVFGPQDPGKPKIPAGVRVDPDNPAAPALLLLIGDVPMAEEVFKTSLSGFAASPAALLLDHLRQRYQMLCAQSLMDRKDAEGLAWSKELVKVAMVQSHFSTKGLPIRTPSIQDPLAFAKDLLADFQRRVDHPKHEPVNVAALASVDKSKRIAALVDALDTVQDRQMGQPGGIDYLGDPVCMAIVNQGKDAVLPLIDAIESDKRFTRTVSFGRDFFPERSIHTVKSMAWNLLTFVWPSATTLYQQGAPIPEASLLRKAWDQQKGMSEEERWLAVLRDDKAGERQWLEAGQSLVSPVGEIRHGSTTYSSPIASAPMSGESLRAAHNEEIIRLMSRRALQIAEPNPSRMDSFACMDALQLGHCLAKWDLTAGAKVLKDVCRLSLETTTNRDMGSSNADRLGTPFGYAISDRAKAHDASAAADYEKLLEVMDPSRGFMDIKFLRPLWDPAGDPGLYAVGERLTANWTKLLRSKDERAAGSTAQSTTNLLTSTPLLSEAYYREFLARAVENEKVFGSLQKNEGAGPQYVTYKLLSGGSSDWRLAPDDDLSILQGDSAPLTVGDFYAHELANGFIKDSPEFHILWPASKRSQARASIAAWLRDTKRDWISVAKTSGFYRMFE